MRVDHVISDLLSILIK